MDARVFQQLLGQVGSMSGAQRGQMAEQLRGMSLRQQVIALIEAHGADRLACPRCGARAAHRHGHAHGLQRWRCCQCARSFNALSGTPLARLREKGKWLPYLACMLDSATVRRAAARTEVHRSTSFRWRHRFLTWAKADRLVPLTGLAEADETYLLESQKGARRLTRPARRRGGGDADGTSSDHVCMLVVRDRGGRTVDAVTGRAPLRCAQLEHHLAPVLGMGSVLVSGAHPAYGAFARACGVSHRAVTRPARGRRPGGGRLCNVTAYRRRFTQWLRRFRGVATRYLSNYLGWQWAVDGGRVGSPAALLSAALGRPAPL